MAIIGDILHSRVARSNILCLQALGAVVRVCAPPALMPARIEANAHRGALTFVGAGEPRRVRSNLNNALKSDPALGGAEAIEAALAKAGSDPKRRAETLSVEEFAAKSAALDQACREEGRSPADVARSVMVPAVVGPPAPPVDEAHQALGTGLRTTGLCRWGAHGASVHSGEVVDETFLFFWCEATSESMSAKVPRGSGECSTTSKESTRS